MAIFDVYKAYTIIYDDNHIYVPIKAKYSPYDHSIPQTKLNYCACMPNLFGGNRFYKGDGEAAKTHHSSKQTLIKEIKEESQGKFILKDGIVADDSGAMFSAVVDSPIEGTGNIKRDHMYFFRHKITDLLGNTDVFNLAGVCLLDKNPASDDEKENSHILKATKADINNQFGAINVDKLYEYCKGRGFCNVAEGIIDFNNSETKKAFNMFLDLWLGA